MAATVARTDRRNRRGRKGSASTPPAASNRSADTPFSFREMLLGRDLPFWAVLLFLVLVFGQLSINFQRFAQKPVPASGAQFFPENLRYQNIDTVVWALTGAMLPGNAPAVRAMRPLYPLPITAARVLGFIHVPAAIHAAPPGSEPIAPFIPLYWTSVRILLGFNVILVVASLWIFFALCRRFGLPPRSASLASLAAGAGFGFSFSVSQAVPDVFGYFTSVAALGAIILAMERDQIIPPQDPSSGTPLLDRAQALRWGSVGLVIGILLLGKELFHLPILGALLLLGTRRWSGLVAFCVAVVLPTILWNFYMARIVGAFDPAKYLNDYKFIVWLWRDLGPLPWPERLAKLVTNLKYQVLFLFQAFAYVPVLLAIPGAFLRPSFPRQTAFLGIFFLSIYLLFLASNFIMPRLMFMAWPVVYFLAWKTVRAGGDRLARLFTRDEASIRTITTATELVVLALAFWAGLQHQFRWYYYG